MFARRFGNGPYINGRVTHSLEGWLDNLEMEKGDFAIIGVGITGIANGKSAFRAGCAWNERIVQVPRHLLIDAKAGIPEQGGVED